MGKREGENLGKRKAKEGGEQERSKKEEESCMYLYVETKQQIRSKEKEVNKCDIN
jgi:hypothetical protein